jgi:Fe-S-cluster containining protein
VFVSPIVATLYLMAKIKYDCLNCVGYCCAIYERVQVSEDDIIRLGNHFGILPEAARRRYTKKHASGERVLRRTPDPIFGESCIFQDPVKRLCSIYEGRPEVCREWPTHGGGRCVYYDTLQFERRQQENPDVVPLIQITFPEGARGR